MKRIILVRYGSWENGHLNEAGRQEMHAAAERLRTEIDGQKTCVIAGKVARATEGAELIAQDLDLPFESSHDELYAAEEDGRLPDPRKALEVIQRYELDNVIAIVSREHIETLPVFVSQTVFNKSVEREKPSLGRGEALVIDLQKQELRYLR